MPAHSFYPVREAAVKLLSSYEVRPGSSAHVHAAGAES